MNKSNSKPWNVAQKLVQAPELELLPETTITQDKPGEPEKGSANND